MCWRMCTVWTLVIFGTKRNHKHRALPLGFLGRERCEILNANHEMIVFMPPRR